MIQAVESIQVLMSRLSVKLALHGEQALNTRRKTREFAVAAISIAVLANGGCSTSSPTWTSMNPFSKPPVGEVSADSPKEIKTAIAPVVSEPAVVSKTSAEKERGFTSSAKRAWNSTTGAVTGLFKRSGEEPKAAKKETADPLSLANRPDQVNSEVYIANGQLWESTGDFNKAMESYSRALESEPGNGLALASIARLHFRQQNFTEAAKFFEAAIGQNPLDAGLHNDLGLTKSKLGDIPRAVQCLQRSLELTPGNSRYANNLASVLFEYGQKEAAMRTLTANNRPAVAHFNIAYLHFQSGNLSQARTHLIEVMKYEPIASEDVATRRAVERTREMLASLDVNSQGDSGERIAQKPDYKVSANNGNSANVGAQPVAHPTGSAMEAAGPMTMPATYQPSVSVK